MIPRLIIYPYNLTYWTYQFIFLHLACILAVSGLAVGCSWRHSAISSCRAGHSPAVITGRNGGLAPLLTNSTISARQTWLGHWLSSMMLWGQDVTSWHHYVISGNLWRPMTFNVWRCDTMPNDSAVSADRWTGRQKQWNTLMGLNLFPQLLTREGYNFFCKWMALEVHW